jgi:hypothetical protein
MAGLPGLPELAGLVGLPGLAGLAGGLAGLGSLGCLAGLVGLACWAGWLRWLYPRGWDRYLEWGCLRGLSIRCWPIIELSLGWVPTPTYIRGLFSARELLVATVRRI